MCLTFYFLMYTIPAPVGVLKPVVRVPFRGTLYPIYVAIRLKRDSRGYFNLNFV